MCTESWCLHLRIAVKGALIARPLYISSISKSFLPFLRVLRPNANPSAKMGVHFSSRQPSNHFQMGPLPSDSVALGDLNDSPPQSTAVHRRRPSKLHVETSSTADSVLLLNQPAVSQRSAPAPLTPNGSELLIKVWFFTLCLLLNNHGPYCRFLFTVPICRGSLFLFARLWLLALFNILYADPSFLKRWEPGGRGGGGGYSYLVVLWSSLQINKKQSQRFNNWG